MIRDIDISTSCSFLYLQMKEMTILDRCLKETLRLRPPIMTMMRMAKEPLVSEYVNILKKYCS